MATIATAAAIGGAAVLPAEAAINTSQFCANVPQGQSGFTDISGVATAQRRDIECLAASGITSGTSATTYGPSGTVFRDGMATFVAKLVDTANALELTTLAALPSDPPDAFTDDETTVHEANINRLAAASIVQGKTATTYGPNGAGNEVNRGQMATFLVNAIEYLQGDDLAAGSNAFTDDAANAHEASINKLAAIDVVDGVGGTAYNPNGFVSRAQMASFLARTLAWLHSEGLIAALPPTTQTIFLAPTGTQANEIDGEAGGELTLTASNIEASDVDVALFPCEHVHYSAAGISFTDAAPDDAIADPGGDLVEADIVRINSTNQGSNVEHASGVVVTEGSITLLVDSPQIDCVVAVVWDDADDDDRVDLAADNRPSETFGTSGQLVFIPPPASTGPMDEDVFSVDKANDRFAGCELGLAPGAGDAPESGLNEVSATDCALFSYDSNDLFYIRNDADLVGDEDERVPMAEFEAALSNQDDVAGTYQASAAAQSSFVLVDESPGAPGGVSAAAVDADTVTVTFNEVSGVDSYRVYRNPEPGDSCPAFTTSGGNPYVLAGSVNGGAADTDSGTTNTFTDNGLASLTRYCYVVTSIDDGDESAPSTAAAATTQDDNIPPLALDTELTTQVSNADLDTGDVIQICFDQAIANPSDGTVLEPDVESLTLRDGDGTEIVLSNGSGGNATFRTPQTTVAVGAPGSPTCASDRVLEVVLGSTPTPTQPGSQAGMALPATILAASNIEDLGGEEFNPAASGQDLVVDIEGGAEPS